MDWPGHVCSVIFLGGCSFRCPVCQNPQLVLTPHELPDMELEDALAYLGCRRRWIDGLTISGGEPTMHADLLPLLERVNQEGIPIKLDTNGSRPDVLRKILEQRLVSAVFMDVKAPLNSREYSQVAGISLDVARIKESIQLLQQADIEVVFRTTVIPGLVEEKELARIRQSLSSCRPFVIQGFRSRNTLDPRLRTLPEFTPERLAAMKRRFEVRFPRTTKVEAWSLPSSPPRQQPISSVYRKACG